MWQSMYEVLGIELTDDDMEIKSLADTQLRELELYWQMRMFNLFAIPLYARTSSDRLKFTSVLSKEGLSRFLNYYFFMYDDGSTQNVMDKIYTEYIKIVKNYVLDEDNTKMDSLMDSYDAYSIQCYIPEEIVAAYQDKYKYNHYSFNETIGEVIYKNYAHMPYYLKDWNNAIAYIITIKDGDIRLYKVSYMHDKLQFEKLDIVSALEYLRNKLY